MNDENKENPDLHDDQHDHDDFEDTFEDAFGIDDAPLQEPLTPEEIEAQERAIDDETAIERPAKKSGSLLPVVIGVAVLGFLGWKLYGTFFAKPNDTTAQNAPSIDKAPPTDMAALPGYETQPIEPPTTHPNAPSTVPDTSHAPVTTVEPSPIESPTTAPAPTPAPAPAPLSATTPESPLSATAKASEPSKETQAELAKLQTKLDEQDKAYKQKMDALEKEVELTKQNAISAARALSGIQRDLNTLSTAVQQLNTQIGSVQQNQERQEVRRQLTSTKKAKSGTKSAEKQHSLTVYAIIPGRAWLRSSNGKTLSVTEGEPIAEYGKVLKIDAGNGVVITTSGEVLR